MPKLNAVIENLEAVEETHRGFYAQGQDGKYYLAVDGVDNLPTVAGLKANQQALLNEKKTLQEKLDTLKDVDPEEYRKLKKDMDDAARNKAKDAGDWESRERQLIEKHTQELEAEKARGKNLLTAVEEALVDSAAVKAIEKEGGNVTLLLPHVKSRMRVVEGKDGKFHAEVLDASGNPLIGDGKGNPMTAEQLVGTMKEDVAFGGAFKPSGNSGSGADPAAGTSTPAGTVNANDAQGIANQADKIVSGEVSIAA